jgi:hypothetical protein
MKHYYKVYFKSQSALAIGNLDFEKRVKDVGMRDRSYILYTENKNVVSIIPVDSVLYILKVEEE